MHRVVDYFELGTDTSGARCTGVRENGQAKYNAERQTHPAKTTGSCGGSRGLTKGGSNAPMFAGFATQYENARAVCECGVSGFEGGGRV